MVSEGISSFKYLLFTFNFVFVIFGVLLSYFGYSTISKIGHHQELITNALDNVVTTLIIIGYVIFFIAFLGCRGAIKESYSMLITFSAIILVILVIEVIDAGLVLAFKYRFKNVAEDRINIRILKYDNITHSVTDLVLDDLQSELKCCGSINARDWKKNPHFSDGLSFPYSCCSIPPQPFNYTCTDVNHLYNKGCAEAIDKEMRGSFDLLGGIAIANAFIQLLGIIFACTLSRNIRSEYKVV